MGQMRRRERDNLTSASRAGGGGGRRTWGKSRPPYEARVGHTDKRDIHDMQNRVGRGAGWCNWRRETGQEEGQEHIAVRVNQMILVRVRVGQKQLRCTTLGFSSYSARVTQRQASFAPQSMVREMSPEAKNKP